MIKKWWHDKVAYQIYPKSFYDSNGDGIGDIPGIISKLDYLHDLGVDIVWLSPWYKSPLADQGYDISDYYGIDPRFGTMEDMDRLIAEAKKRNMYILMDLVVNHCSDEHEWFQKACEDPEGKYGRFFYLRDKKEGELPTNWRSYFGGPVWEDLPGTDKQYLHVFHKKQPDLNWENPELREEVNVEAELADENSVLHFYKKLIALRKDPVYKETVVYGSLEPLWEEKHNLMAYYRKGDKTLLVVGNYQRHEQEITLPAAYQKALLNNYADIAEENGTIRLHGYQVLILEMEEI